MPPSAPAEPRVEEAAFLARLPERFEAAQAREQDAYDDIIYRLADRRATPEDLDRMEAFCPGGGSVKGLKDPATLETLNRVLRAIRYPDVQPLAKLQGVPGLTMPVLTTVLHFFHPAYPLLDPRSVAALQGFGHPVECPTEVTDAALAQYRGYIAAIERLKETVDAFKVPGSNCWLTRVVQAGLSAQGDSP